MASLQRTVARRLLLSGAIVGGTGLALGGGTALALGLTYWGIRQSRRYRLSGRVVLITGGSRGLGFALARQFLRRRATVALLARDPEALERARQLLAGQGTVFVRCCDLREESKVQEAIADVRRQLGEIDVLVNNAGTLTVGPMETMSADEYREALSIFLWAPLYATLAVLPAMRQRRQGRIVNISSIGGKIAVPHLLPYSTGKFALSGWSEGLHAEVAKDNVKVTTVYPGLMRTGSPRNADFKGKHRAEYTWFLLSDSIPGLSINADRAARQIVRACEFGKSELIVSLPAKLAIKAHNLFPSLSAAALEFANRLLPDSEGADGTKRKGAQSTTPLTESWLTTLDQEAARKNNQIRNPTAVTL
ncbi:MAG: SDR family NAD(P)-dependent oxidoreductase [Acidobacteria bacterium]|nr:SDR family NAD(P)-dependent oxidoreductase [Acidobacteriota bacterium]MBV9623813.1 SDR family NAD(P)-dependent oxidoreductase [Acidobacteriota bacterium]